MSIFRTLFPQKAPQYIREKYNIPERINWKIELNSNGLVATSEELPGLVTNASSPKELLEMINDAVLEYFDVPKMESDFIFDTLNLDGHGTVQLKKAKESKQYA